MPLTPGTRLGPYEIVAPLGAGGMGEVYRARDTRLDRTVAIKILPGHLAADPAFKARFEREARAVSALSHPHICTLHDIGEQSGTHFLVMEHLEGETLAARLQRGAMPPEEAIRVAAQIASALAQAHRQGVVHRDLKPANVFLTKNGAKLLDFGLAKQGAQAAPPISSAVMTEASPLTAAGTIVGTWQYMAPEQLEGAEADARSDLFAFGALLYEMITGRRAFEGRSQASLIAAIMGSQPLAVSAVAPGVPPALDRVVRRCLAKDPDERWQSAADLASELKWIGQESASGTVASSTAGAPVVAGSTGFTGTSMAGVMSGAAGDSVSPVPGTSVVEAPPRVPVRSVRGERIAWIAVTLALLAAVAALAYRTYLGRSEEPPRLITASLLPPPGATFDTRYAPAVSPDGKMIAVVVSGADSKSSLYLRDLANGEMKQLPGTETAAFPFWSPDSHWIGFYSGDKLKKVDTAGGASIVLCDAQDGRGGSWNRDGVILFEPRFSEPLYKVPSGGGTPEPVTKLDEKQFHVSHRWPDFLPDGRHFLFFVVATTNPVASEHSGIYIGSLDSPEIRQVLRVPSRMAYVQGNLLYRRGTTLMAQAFDPESATLSGDPIPLAGEVSGTSFSWAGADFGVSDQGVLAYRSGTGEGETDIVWFDRSGKRLGQVGESGFVTDIALSRDGRRLVANVGKDSGDLWLADLDRDVRSRLTFDPADDSEPVFSPDGKRVAFLSSRKQMGELYVRDAQGTGQDTLLYSSGTQIDPTDWSVDGRWIILSSLDRKTGFDLWTYSFADKKAAPWLEEPFDQFHGRFSPNGRWVAYDSNESGRSEIYVRSFPEKGGGRWQVSRASGTEPTWRADGKELFFLGGDGNLMAVDVRTEGSFDSGTPHPLFKAQVKSVTGECYHPSPDGKRFVMNTLKESDRIGQSVTLVLNWPAALKK